MKRLNGWQRLGVIVSVIWLPIGFLWGNSLFIQVQTDGPERVMMSCNKINSALGKPLEECYKQFHSAYAASIAGHWWAGVVAAILPLLLAWGLAWVGLCLGRWVHAGFTKGKA